MTAENWTNLFNDNIVCHYTKREVALEKIFQTGTIKLGKMENTNDPYEIEGWSLVNFDKSRFNDLKMEPDQNIDIDMDIRDIQRQTRLFCCTMDSKDPIYRNKATGSFGRAFANPAVWAHYGENHKGICLVFDKFKLQTLLSNKFHNCTYNEVTYDLTEDTYESTITMPLGDNGHTVNAMEVFKSNLLPMHFKKHFYWKYESEFRIIVINETNDNLEFPIKDCLKGIIISLNFQYCYLPSIKECAKRFKTDLFRIEYFHSVPSLSNIST